MPQANNALHYAQWDMCDQCGHWYPMDELVKQKGALICTRRHCFDNLEVERRPLIIMEVLGNGVDIEGADMRVIDRGFFEGFDETDR